MLLLDDAMEKLISEQQIQQRVIELATQITKDYQGKPLVVVGVLKGAFVFMSDLVRHIDLPIECDFIRVASYRQGQNSGRIVLSLDLSHPIKDKHVLLVEDIVDSGTTLRFLLDHLKAKQPASVRVCSMTCKKKNSEIRKAIDYLGFEIPDVWAVGYGMDLDGQHRALPYIAAAR